MLELSPLLTAAKALACSMPAATSVSWSNPMPVIRLAAEVFAQAAEGVRVLVDHRRRCDRAASSLWASDEPTRPQPMTTMCTAGTSPLQSLVAACRRDGTQSPAPAPKSAGAR